ncbi:MAG: hypothetical protein ACI837_002477 [Crocinitomicaceae bacterium]|jgi:hypothetical protein
MKIFFVAFIGLSLVSCIDLEKSDQLARIDAMNATLDSIETVFNDNQIDSLAVIKLNAYSVENRIKNNYNSDTINMELGRKMDAFKVMRKNLTPLSKAITGINSGLEEERSKLIELKTDIDNSNGERDKYEEHLLFEEAKVDQMCALITDYVLTKNISLATYEEIYVELNEFSMSLLKK